jgi:cell division protein YceG involved in septum cleavage
LARGDRSGSERTAEQRERDREERERRRAGKSGSPTAPEQPLPGPTEPVAPAHVGSAEPVPAMAPESPLPTPPAAEEQAAALAEPAPAESYEPPPTEPLELPAREPAAAAHEEDPAQEPWPAPWPDPEPAPPVRERPVEGPAPEPDPMPQPEPKQAAAEGGRIGKAPPPISAARKRTRRPAARGLPVVAGPPGERKRAHVPRLAALIALGAVAIAVVLAVVSLSSKSSPKPLPVTPVVSVLIPEGKTRAQIDVIAKAKGLTGSYRKASEHSQLLDPATYGAPKGTPDLEGFLFPATYELDKGAPALRLVEEQLAAFSEHFGPPQIARAKALHVTPYQLLTVASMVEREALIPGDRAKIAAVIYNRLARKIPLGIDASIYYAVELEKNIPTYTQELTESQLHIDSPYNTRLHTGLPPTPISNPGAASIEAAAHPAKVGYLYYVAGADGCGEQVFSESQSVFETDVAAYKTAVEKNGGHPPVCKKK